ncbi:phosphodiesterase, partial [Pseudomonadota bacterium]
LARMLRNREELFEVLSGTHGNFVVLCGHAHQEYVKQVNGVTLMGAPSTCTQFKPGTDVFGLDDLAPGFRVIELYGSGRFESRVVRLGST